MGTIAGEAWRPCPGRAVVCRRPGCSAPATTEVLALCEDHLLAYKAELAPLLGEVEARRAKAAGGKAKAGAR